MPGRRYEAVSEYRYGFNGKEKDKDMSAGDLDFGARIYDARVGRWLSVDPLQTKYPSLTPYNFVANSSINAIDPDGKVIIFINGLWGFPTQAGKGGTDDYWGEWNGRPWTKVAQDVIGDHKTPLYYDGSLGGTIGYKYSTKSNLPARNRINAGKKVGYNEAKSIITNLDKDETIKIITNSMGAAFERGFSEGLFKYRDERIGELDVQIFGTTLYKNILETQIGAKRVAELTPTCCVLAAKPAVTDLEKNYMKAIGDLGMLNAEKEKLKNLQIEMVIDLSSHQIDYMDRNADNSYYMYAGDNMTFAEGFFVEEKTINNANSLGKMDGHHASNADPNKFPSAKKRN